MVTAFSCPCQPQLAGAPTWESSPPASASAPTAREGLKLGTRLESDTTLLATTPGVHVLRDPTRGGLASSLNEIAQTSRVGITLKETALPVRPEVQAACDLLGTDPLYVANEGKLTAIVTPESAKRPWWPCAAILWEKTRRSSAG